MKEREVVINSDGLLNVNCPMTFSSQEGCWPCNNGCAWFSISLDRDNELSSGEKTIYADYAYCKDHRIGKIKESK